MTRQIVLGSKSDRLFPELSHKERIERDQKGLALREEMKAAEAVYLKVRARIQKELLELGHHALPRTREQREAILLASPHRKPVMVEGVKYHSILEAERATGITSPTIRKRLRNKVKGYAYLTKH